MTDLVSQHRAELARLCRDFGVARLELFGSATNERFSAAQSDIDLVVEFLPAQPLGPWLGHFFSFRKQLEQVFGRRVDLVLRGRPRNPYFASELERTKELLYSHAA